MGDRAEDAAGTLGGGRPCSCGGWGGAAWGLRSLPVWLQEGSEGGCAVTSGASPQPQGIEAIDTVGVTWFPGWPLAQEALGAWGRGAGS